VTANRNNGDVQARGSGRASECDCEGSAGGRAARIRNNGRRAAQRGLHFWLHSAARFLGGPTAGTVGVRVGPVRYISSRSIRRAE